MSDYNLFIYKKESIYFLNFICIQFSKNIYTYCIKRIYYKISIWTQKLFLLAFARKKKEFLQFYLQNYFNLFSFKKSDLYKLFKKT